MDEVVIGIASRYLDDDPAGLREVLAAIDGLLDDPWPDNSFRIGESPAGRLRVGRYRVVYEVEDTAVKIRHLARTATG
jgi:mRNA interferase RelE/StbE